MFDAALSLENSPELVVPADIIAQHLSACGPTIKAIVDHVLDDDERAEQITDNIIKTLTQSEESG